MFCIPEWWPKQARYRFVGGRYHNEHLLINGHQVTVDIVGETYELSEMELADGTVFWEYHHDSLLFGEADQPAQACADAVAKLTDDVQREYFAEPQVMLDQMAHQEKMRLGSSRHLSKLRRRT